MRVSSTASEIYKSVKAGTGTIPAECHFKFNRFKDYHYNILNGKQVCNNLDKMHSQFMGGTEILPEHFGTIVYAAYRFWALENLQEITKEFEKSKFLPGTKGNSDNYFIKLTHKMEYNGALYFRWVDRNNSIGSMFIKKTPANDLLCIHDCIGINAKIRQFKKNKFTGFNETVFSDVKVIKNYGPK